MTDPIDYGVAYMYYDLVPLNLAERRRLREETLSWPRHKHGVSRPHCESDYPEVLHMAPLGFFVVRRGDVNDGTD